MKELLILAAALVAMHWLSAGPSEIVERPVDIPSSTP